MKLALFDDHRLGVVVDGGLVDVTHAIPYWHDTDPLTAGWWRGLCRDFDAVRDHLHPAATGGAVLPLEELQLRAPVLNPSKVIAAASNYADHVTEMHSVQERTLGRVDSWMMNFDVFLKAPSSISGPTENIQLPEPIVAAGHEIHHESELVAVIGTAGKDIDVRNALDHVFGYTIGLDITVRSEGDRSRRKSHDTFSPTGPWVTTRDEVRDAHNLDIRLQVNGEQRQHVSTRNMLTTIPEIIAHTSRVMTLFPGDLIFTGAPPGVGPIHPGDHLVAQISGLGEMEVRVSSGSAVADAAHVADR